MAFPFTRIDPVAGATNVNHVVPFNVEFVQPVVTWAPPADGAQVTTGWTNSTLNGTTWFTFVAPATGSVRVNGNAINYNGQIGIYEVTDCADFATFSLVAANDNEIDGPSLAPNFTVC